MCYESWYRKQEELDAAEKARTQTDRPDSTKPAPAAEPSRRTLREEIAPVAKDEEAVA